SGGPSRAERVSCVQCLSYFVSESPWPLLAAQPISPRPSRNAKSKCLREVPMSENDFSYGTGIAINALKRRISQCRRRRSTWALVEGCFFGFWAFPFPSSSCWRCSGTTNTNEASPQTDKWYRITAHSGWHGSAYRRIPHDG